MIVHLMPLVLVTIKLYLTALVPYDLTLVSSLSHTANHFYVFLGEMVIQFLCIFKDSVAIYGWVLKVPCMLWTLEPSQSYLLY